MRLYLRLAWRNLWRHRRRTLIVVLAIGLTMAMMMLYDGLIAGFDQAIYGNAIKVLGGNIQVHAEGYPKKRMQNPLLPLANDQAVVQSGAGPAAGCGGLAPHQHRRAGQQPQGRFRGQHHRHRAGAGAAGQPGGAECDRRALSDRRRPGHDLYRKGLADAMGVKVGDRITLAGRATHEQMRQPHHDRGRHL